MLMAMSGDEEKKARDQFEKNINDVDSDNIEYALRKGRSKVQEFGAERMLNMMLVCARRCSGGARNVMLEECSPGWVRSMAR